MLNRPSFRIYYTTENAMPGISFVRNYKFAEVHVLLYMKFIIVQVFLSKLLLIKNISLLSIWGHGSIGSPQNGLKLWFYDYILRRKNGWFHNCETSKFCRPLCNFRFFPKIVNTLIEMDNRMLIPHCCICARNIRNIRKGQTFAFIYLNYYQIGSMDTKLSKKIFVSIVYCKKKL